MRELILLRHAHAEPATTGQSDLDRPLSPQGLAEAEAVARWLKEQGLVPDRGLCSPARRTRETLGGAFEQAIEYVTQDSRATMDVSQHLATHGGFDWVSARGSRMIFRLPPSLMNPHTWTVENLLSKAWSTAERWITTPVEKADFTTW